MSDDLLSWFSQGHSSLLASCVHFFISKRASQCPSEPRSPSALYETPCLNRHIFMPGYRLVLLSSAILNCSSLVKSPKGFSGSVTIAQLSLSNQLLIFIPSNEKPLTRPLSHWCLCVALFLRVAFSFTRRL